jgi:hypothetical protein
MKNKDKEAFDEWRKEYVSTHTGYFKMIGTDDLAQVVWESACEYMRNKSNSLDALSLYEKLEREREENKKLREALEFYAKETNWKLNKNNHAPLFSKCENDLGDIAREALK